MQFLTLNYIIGEKKQTHEYMKKNKCTPRNENYVTSLVHEKKINLDEKFMRKIITFLMPH